MRTLKDSDPELGHRPDLPQDVWSNTTLSPKVPPFHQCPSRWRQKLLFFSLWIHQLGYIRIVYFDFMSSFYFCPASYCFYFRPCGTNAEFVVSPSASQPAWILTHAVFTLRIEMEALAVVLQQPKKMLPGDAGCSEKALSLFVSLQSKCFSSFEWVSATSLYRKDLGAIHLMGLSSDLLSFLMCWTWKKYIHRE